VDGKLNLLLVAMQAVALDHHFDLFPFGGLGNEQGRTGIEGFQVLALRHHLAADGGDAQGHGRLGIFSFAD